MQNRGDRGIFVAGKAKAKLNRLRKETIGLCLDVLGSLFSQNLGCNEKPKGCMLSSVIGCTLGIDYVAIVAGFSALTFVAVSSEPHSYSSFLRWSCHRRRSMVGCEIGVFLKSTSIWVRRRL